MAGQCHLRTIWATLLSAGGRPVLQHPQRSRVMAFSAVRSCLLCSSRRSLHLSSVLSSPKPPLRSAPSSARPPPAFRAQEDREDEDEEGEADAVAAASDALLEDSDDLPTSSPTSASSFRTPPSSPAAASAEHQRLVELVDAGEIDDALTHLQSFHRTAHTDSWHLLLSALHIRSRFDEMTAVWNQWQSLLPPLPSTADPAQSTSTSPPHNVPTSLTYSLLRSSPTFALSAVVVVEELTSRGSAPTSLQWNQAIKELHLRKDFPAMKAMLQRMQQSGAPSTNFTLSLRLSVLFSDSGSSYNSFISLWKELLHSTAGSAPTMSICTAFAFKFVEHKDIMRVMQVVDLLDAMRREAKGRANTQHHLNGVACQRMATCLMKHDKPLHLVRLYEYMKSARLPLTPLMFSTLISASSKEAGPASIEMLYKEMTQKGVKPTQRLFHVMMKAYGRLGGRDGVEWVMKEAKRVGQRVGAEGFAYLFHGLREWHHDLETKAEGEGQKQGKGKRKGKKQWTGIGSTLRLSSSLLPYMAVMEDKAIAPSAEVYRILLQALIREDDTATVLHYLMELTRRGLAMDQVALDWVIQRLAEQPPSFTSQSQEQRTQLDLLLESRDDLVLSSEVWHALLHLFAAHHHIATMKRLYTRMGAAEVTPSSLLFLRLMTACWQADDSDVKQLDRMQLIIQLYGDMSWMYGAATDIAVYDLVLSAHAVLGDTESMKEVFRCMKEANVKVGPSTIRVLEQARLHVMYTAEMLQWVLEQKTRMQTLDMEEHIMTRRHRRHLTPPAAPPDNTQPPMTAEPSLSTRSGELFALPEWSPLYTAARSAAAAVSMSSGKEVESLLATLVAGLQERILQSSTFPLAKETQSPLPLQLSEEGPGMEELRQITAEIAALQQQWPMLVQPTQPSGLRGTSEKRRPSPLVSSASSAPAFHPMGREESKMRPTSSSVGVRQKKRRQAQHRREESMRQGTAVREKQRSVSYGGSV